MFSVPLIRCLTKSLSAGALCREMGIRNPWGNCQSLGAGKENMAWGSPKNEERLPLHAVFISAGGGIKMMPPTHRAPETWREANTSVVHLWLSSHPWRSMGGFSFTVVGTGSGLLYGNRSILYRWGMRDPCDSKEDFLGKRPIKMNRFFTEII